jgi:sporulation protein YlmC with PRC-barrel domain
MGGKMARKNAEIISTKVKNLDRLGDFSSYMGRKVFSKSGHYVGKVYDIITQNKCMVGVLVRGKLKIFIDKEYFMSDTPKAIMLSIDPVTNLLGKQVFDAIGKRIGKVSALERRGNSNVFSSLIVKKRAYSKPFVVPKKDIDTFKDNVILKKEHKG